MIKSIDVFDHECRVSISNLVLVLKDEGRFNRPSLKQIRMIADLPQLHKDTHYAKEVTISKDVPSLIGVDILVVEQPLPP